MFWHNINNEGGTKNFNINIVLQGMDCEDVDWPPNTYGWSPLATFHIHYS